jgi:hypothetical protein
LPPFQQDGNFVVTIFENIGSDGDRLSDRPLDGKAGVVEGWRDAADDCGFGAFVHDKVFNF